MGRLLGPRRVGELSAQFTRSASKQSLVNHSYRAYGLGLLSSVRIAGLPTVPHNSFAPDLFFECGPQPEWVSEGQQLPARILHLQPGSKEPYNPSFTLTEYGTAHCFHFAYSDGVQFVMDGETRRVWGAFEPPETSEDLATYFLGPIMGFLLRRRHITSLHASAVEIAGQAVVFSGNAGYGKSTTAAALALRGRPVVGEDIVPLRECGSRFEAIPGYPRICLWPDAVASLLGSAEALPHIAPPVWEKRYLPLDGVRANFVKQPLGLGLVYLFSPRRPASDAPRIEQLRPRIALLELVQNTYMNWLLDREQRAIEFDVLARLVQSVPVRRIVPHTDPEKIGTLCDLILKDAESFLPSSRTDSVCG
jgi:hypothetical protein